MNEIITRRGQDMSTEESATKPADDVPVGAFVASLKRNNKQIKSDRADAISEDAQLIFRRKVEDLDVDVKRLRRDRENMLDLSSDSAISLKLAENFDSRKFVDEDIRLGVDIRNTEIKLEIARARYEHLFGVTV